MTQKFAIVVVILISINHAIYSQEVETVGAGVLDFLISNPSTADKLNPTQAVALRIIGGLLKTSAQRKHDMNVANAGRSEIIINTTNGNQATIYSDNQGNLYLLNNGTIYPISRELINLANNEFASETIKNSTLQPFNLIDLEKEYKSFRKERVKTEMVNYHFEERHLYLKEIASAYNVTIDDIYFRPYIRYPKVNDYKNGIKYPKKYSHDGYYSYKELVVESNIPSYCTKSVYNSWTEIDRSIYYGCSPNIFESCKSAKKWRYIGLESMRIDFAKGERSLFGKHQTTNQWYADGYDIFIQKYKEIPAFDIKVIFTCNWYKDFENDGVSFSDFQGVKRSFMPDEKITVVISSSSNEESDSYIEIFSSSKGELIYYENRPVLAGFRVNGFELESNNYEPGVYIYSIRLENNDNKIVKTGKFEIVEKE